MKKSSGANKAESLTNGNKGTSKKTTTNDSIIKESDQAPALKRREKARLMKAQRREKRLERKLALKEKALERKTQRDNRRALLKSESKAQRHERILKEREARLAERAAKREARLAEKQAKREHRIAMQAQRRANAKERRHAPGFGGWLAAVISLGATTLVLGTMVTFGWMQNNGMQTNFATAHMRSIYELNGLVDELENNLSKARVATGTKSARLLCQISADSLSAESVLERLPLEDTSFYCLSAHLNDVGDFSQAMLIKLSEGEKLSAEDRQKLNELYEQNNLVKESLNTICEGVSLKSATDMIYGKAKDMTNTLKELENKLSLKDITPSTPTCSDGKIISESRAESIVKSTFSSYNFDKVNVVGETVCEGVNCYNVAAYGEQGDMLVQISKKDGKIALFDSYKSCTTKNFNTERCIDIAEEFLDEMDFDDLTPVWISENGVTCNLTFAYEDDDIIYYTDIIKVKVCEERGIVTGMDATKFIKNNKKRTTPRASISKEKALSNLSEQFVIQSTKLCVIPVEDKEHLCYEFHGEDMDTEFFAYIDAKTGREVELLRVVGTKQGKLLA